MKSSPKIYKSQLGLKFAISEVPHPFEIDNGDAVIFINGEEFDYIKEKKFTPQEFKVIWESRKLDHRSKILPDHEGEKECQRLARTIGQEIIDQLKGKRTNDNNNKGNESE